MNRRGFFGRLLGGFAAALAAPVLLEALPAATPALAFHPDAFEMVMNPLDEAWIREHYIRPAVAHLLDESDRRLVVLYGTAERRS